MNAAVDEPSDNLAEQRPAGPGERLKVARQKAGLEPDRVAGQLHLRADQVLALERDDYSSFAARVFVRGYVRNYARLLALPADDILAIFDAAFPDPDKPVELKRIGTHRPQVSSRHGVVRLVSWVLVLGIVALFFVWWAGYLELNGKGTEPPGMATAPGELATTPAPEQLPLAPPATSGETQIELPLPPPPAAPPETAARSPETSGETEAVSPAAPTAPAVSPPDATHGPEIVLTLNGDCWVTIRDSGNTFKMIGEFKAGTRRVLGGTPPYRILLGNASAASLTIDGRPYDLVPHTRAQVARFTLDPAAQ